MYEIARARGWDGRPEEPERSGWHWVHDGDGLRPLLWRGEDWPEAMDRGEWQDGFATLAPDDLRHGVYYGPVPMPPRAASLFRLHLLTNIVGGMGGLSRRGAGMK